MRQTYVGEASKDPIERIDWTENWSGLLVPIDDKIVSLECAITFANTQDDASGELFVASTSFTTLDTTVMLEGGVADKIYAVSFIVDTARLRRFKRSIRVRCFLK